MNQAQHTGRIDVISDVICPWCYIGKRQLEAALDILEKQHLRFTVAWHPFQLNPDMPREASTAPSTADQIRQRRAFARDRPAHHRDGHDGRPGIPSRQADAHAQHAGRPSPDPPGRPEGPAGRRRRGKLFEGYFCNGADIGDHQVLGDLGAEGGLERADVATMLSGEEGLREVMAGDQMARNAGIQGVPSFALEGHVLFSGAVPADEMAQAFRRAWEILRNRAA